MSNKIDSIYNLLKNMPSLSQSPMIGSTNSTPAISSSVTPTSTPIVDNQQNSTENLRICIKHAQIEYFFICPEKMCMHQVENDKHKIKDHLIQFHYNKACSWNIYENNNNFCYYCSKCNRYTVTKHYHCPHCPKWDLTTFKSDKDMENNHLSSHFEILKNTQKKLDNWKWWS